MISEALTAALEVALISRQNATSDDRLALIHNVYLRWYASKNIDFRDKLEEAGIGFKGR